MKLNRVEELGRERATVLGFHVEILRLPDRFRDIDAKFWRQERASELQSLPETHDADDDIKGEVRFGSPISKQEKVISVRLNYRDHATETGSTIPDEPVVFMKAPNYVVGPNDEILVPRNSKKTDWEIILGVVIGQRTRYLVSPNKTREAMAGY